MKLVVLSDNHAHGDCEGEWGLSVYIEYRGKKLLLDTGASDLFLRNAEKLGVAIAEVDFGILSHAHYDHADGLADFFYANSRANFYLRSEARENCWCDKGDGPEYIGIQNGWLTRFQNRIVYCSGRVELMPGVTLLGHTSPGLSELGRKAGMYVSECCGLVPDEFAHEQSLVLDTADGLVILNSCCHGGADTIIRETAEAFPGKKLLAIIGGLHLYRSSPSDVLALADGIQQTGIRMVVTGHCTGDEAMELLRAELGDSLKELYAGLTLTFPE